jgi:hypothetical protein
LQYKNKGGGLSCFFGPPNPLKLVLRRTIFSTMEYLLKEYFQDEGVWVLGFRIYMAVRIACKQHMSSTSFIPCLPQLFLLCLVDRNGHYCLGSIVHHHVSLLFVHSLMRRLSIAIASFAKSVSITSLGFAQIILPCPACVSPA